MNKKAIETLSINAVKDSIDVCEHLSQFISENDKEPSWDGNVYIYDRPGIKKENLIGRVPVQVKGSLNNDFSKGEISFPIKTVDLKNYLSDGGVIFFVVYIGNGGLTRQIYYSVLAPIKLRIILDSAKGQNQKSIKLKKLPNSQEKKENVFFNALNNFKKQHSFNDAELLTLEELKSSGALEGLEIPFISVQGIDPKKVIFDTESYIYARIKGNSIPQPIEAIVKGFVSSEEKDVKISIEDKIYYNRIRIEENGKQVKYIIGDSFTITTEDEGKPITINYKNSSNVRVLAKDLEFIIDFIKHKNFKINGTTVFDKTGWNIDYKNFNIDEQKSILEQAKKTVQLLDVFECSKDLDMSKLGAKDKRYLDLLIRGIVDKEEIKNLNGNISPVSIIKVGELSFWIYMQQTDAGGYHLDDFFTSNLVFSYEMDSGERAACSRYLLPKADDFERIDNIRFGDILNSIKGIDRNSETMTKANGLLMELLKAYDHCKRQIILDTAYDLSKWLFETDDDNLPYEFRLLNYLQVKKRMAELDDKDKELLKSVINNCSDKPDVLVGSYLLLNQCLTAEIYFDKMEEKQQEEFKTFPIFVFWNNNK